MTAIYFFSTYLILIIVSGFFCNGWYKITRGWQSSLPDGKIINEGMVFGFWQRYFEKIIGQKKVFFCGENFEKKVIELEYLKKQIFDKLTVIRNGFAIKPDITLSEKELLEIGKLLSCRVFTENNFIRLYYDYPDYKFPEWVRKPISECVTCYSSVYGSIIWWTFVFCQKNAFLWANHEKVLYFVFWIIFTVSLAFVNDYLFKKTK